MKIVIIGTGYVGLVSGTCFAHSGHRVVCVDVDTQKIAQLKKGQLPIYEPDLPSIFLESVRLGYLTFSNSLVDSIGDADVVFIAVGTPVGEGGSIDLQYVLKATNDIATHMDHSLLIVNKSTSPVGTVDRLKKNIQKILSDRGVNYDFQVISNPEFLREGKAITDFMDPDRVIIGADDSIAIGRLKELYHPFITNDSTFCVMSSASAEMTKYVANAFLAMKVSFINEMANICEGVGVDISRVREGIGLDRRIGYHFMNAGIGYGGSCFPKDVKALQNIAQKVGCDAEIITAVERVNHKQKRLLFDKVVRRFGSNLKGKTFAFWGLSFKPDTDDMREAPAIYTARLLVEAGATLQLYDPQAMTQAKEVYLKGMPNVSYSDELYEVLLNADALLLLTEWDLFKKPDFNRVKETLRNPVIFDGRNQYRIYPLKEMGIEYHGIGLQKDDA